MFFVSPAVAQDSLVATQLLERVQFLQPKTDGVFPIGSIPSWRMYAQNKSRYKADINPFFAGLVAFTLLDLKKDLSPGQEQQANTIIGAIQPFVSQYRNKKNNRDTYNFWTADKPLVFPHGGWMNWMNKRQALPDDLDDTVVLLLAQSSNDSIVETIHDLMQAYVNKPEKKITNTISVYQDLGAYSTWMGKKMPIDFDLSVLCNVLYFVQFHDLAWTKADSASLQFIVQAIQNKHHLGAAALVSPHYARPPVILYHVSRLMSLKPIPALEMLKPQLVAETQDALLDYPNFMDQVILGTSLLRWGISPPSHSVEFYRESKDAIENEDFCFFIANMASMLPNPWKKTITHLQWGSFSYYAPAYNNVLLLENLVWRKRLGLGTW